MSDANPSTSTDTSVSGMPTELDLAFIIDATGSMSSYIKSAQDNMRKIIEDLIKSERCLLNVALILYRDHPPQDSTFIIQLHNFTDDAEEAKKNIDTASASGGGDGPEAMTPALHAAVHTLSWRKTSIKIALLIADAPPHGLETSGDTWPNGDPSGHDPMECASLLAERAITLYTIGCEPAAIPYRDFLMALAFKTGGQYIPLDSSANLASVIVGSAREDISLERLLAQVHEEVMREAELRGGAVDEAELTRRIHEVMHGGGVKARRLKLEKSGGTVDIPSITPAAEELSTLKTLEEVKKKWVRNNSPLIPATGSLFGTPFGLGKHTVSTGARTKGKRSALVKKAATKRKRVSEPKVKATASKKAKVQSKSTVGIRRSARLNFNLNKPEENEEEEEEESTEDEEMETTPIPEPPKAKPAKLKTEISNVSLKEDELLDITQTRRLVRKCVARNKFTTK